ncbi:MAG: cell division protein FtsH, partial [Sulfurimonas sp.]
SMDDFIKTSLHERYEIVVARLEEYREAIEEMVALLYKKENIEGSEVREIILNFEKANNIDSKVTQDTSHIEDELKQDATMSPNKETNKAPVDEDREQEDEK